MSSSSVSGRRSTLTAAVIVAVGLVLSSVVVANAFGNPGADSPPNPTAAVETAAGQSARLDGSRSGQSVPGDGTARDVALDLNRTFVTLAEAATPAVVRIEVRRESRTARSQTPQFEVPEPFRRFFELPNPEGPGQEPAPQVAGGTGFIVSGSGHVVTNHHVVRDADEITVWMENRHRYEASLVGSDPTTDIAVIRIEGDRESFPTIPWGESNALRVGEWVVAVGNPGVGNGQPLDYTVTTGIVSAKNRPLQLLGRSLQQDPEFGADLAGYAIENFIQTDAVINPGNSGGPLLNLFGEVVGVNTAIASASGYYQGYGFAVPADLAERVVDDLVEDGVVQRAWLGVSVSPVAPEDADYYELPRVAGALVQDVSDGSPAEVAGLQAEDVIVAVDGEPVERSGNLQQLIAQRRPDEEVTLTVYRDGEARDIGITLGEAPLSERSEPAGPRREAGVVMERLGIEVERMSPTLAREFGYEEADGVIVTDVEQWGPAARRGVGPGARLVEVNRSRVTEPEDVERALAGVQPDAVVTLLLETPDGTRRIVNVRAR